PFSEFLQKNVFEMNGLTSTGKLSDDFRITKIGKFFRKYWIDELPQLLDWFRGEIKLVGIRAMSQHYFGLYSTEYQNLYFQVKPGILSPIFDENSDSFEDIQKIEQEYLEKYLKNPFLTDVKYFWLTLIDILKGIRSS
ncbi:MAG: sugar transferase, partial [Desulfobacula sp.]|nr:sugar transferase [Desulfobacula sp.]